MLEHLLIQNYALIHHLDIRFFRGFSAITGETGAGKSILMDALDLVLGKRADTQVLLSPDKSASSRVYSPIQATGLVLSSNCITWMKSQR